MQQCGFCSALAEVFRRLLCIGSSRRGSGESYYHELEEEDPRRGGISIDRSENGLFIRMIDSNTSSLIRTKSLSNSDKLLLEALDTCCRRQHHTGRFLTMHKRRRKRLITRSLTQDHALLDDIHHGQVQFVLDRVSQWPFNAFILDNVTGGRSLPVLCVHLFHWYGLLDHFKLDVVRCWKFFSLIEEGYHSTNPYHNSIHATDVTQAMHCFLQEKKIREYLTPLEIMASLIAAVTHDLDHPGVNQPFLIATSNHLAALYENSSVLENHHWRSAIGCLLESHVAEDLEDCRLELQRQISSLILATDITRQQEFLVRFKKYLDQDILDMELQDHRHFILQIALKCADISNPCRPWEVSKKWSQKVCEEFFRQGDYERQLNLPVTALCDRQTSSVPKIQAGFFTFVVYPLFEEWHRFLGDGLSDDMMKNLHGNKLKWDALIKEENAEKSRANISDKVSDGTGEVHGEALVSNSNTSSLESCRIHFLPTSDLNSQQKVERRHSLPASMAESSYRQRGPKSRRESLAIGEKKTLSKFQSGFLKEEEEVDEDCEKEKEESSYLERASLSGDSNSDGSDNGETEKRPLSSENLLPELSITSITTVLEASRLSNVLHREPDLQKSISRAQLKRQQTFPPLLPYVRQRYFSTTADMSRYTEFKGDLNPSNKNGQKTNQEESEEHPLASSCGTTHGCKTPPTLKAAVLKESNNRSPLSHSDNDRQTNCKRETDDSSQEKGAKVAKLHDDTRIELCEKENLDPINFGNDLDVESSVFLKNGAVRKNSVQVHMSKRRGSAPVGSDFFSPLALAFRGCGERYSRRGSAPINAISYSVDNEKYSDAAIDVSLTSSQQHCPYQRRGSIPAEIGWSEAIKPKNWNKKVLRRRSSGGPEMFCFSQTGNDGVRWKVDVISKRPASESNPDWLVTRRRGSLPIDFLLAKPHSGDHREIHDS